MHKAEVYILGQKYTIKGEKDAEYIQELAAYVDKKLRKVYEQNANMPPLRAAILTCLYIADELYEVKMELEETKKQFKKLEERTNELLILLE